MIVEFSTICAGTRLYTSSSNEARGARSAGKVRETVWTGGRSGGRAEQRPGIILNCRSERSIFEIRTGDFRAITVRRPYVRITRKSDASVGTKLPRVLRYNYAQMCDDRRFELTHTHTGVIQSERYVRVSRNRRFSEEKMCAIIRLLANLTRCPGSGIPRAPSGPKVETKLRTFTRNNGHFATTSPDECVQYVH